MKPDCMFFTSSITQVSHTSSAITPDTAATRPVIRSAISSRLISFTGVSAVALTMAALTPLLLSPPGSPAAEAWKECWFNDRPFACRDREHADGSVTIVWQDGAAMTYRLVREGFPRSSLRDSLGGLWEREVLVQGNAVFTHVENGNRIVVPLR